MTEIASLLGVVAVIAVALECEIAAAGCFLACVAVLGFEG
jgi:hypothetical protein